VSAIDWAAADKVAAQLGAHTRGLVAGGDADVAREWALRMSRVHVGEGNVLRALSYLELAVLTGHREKEADDLARREWGELAQMALDLAATVKAKATQEAAAAAMAKAETKSVEVEATAAAPSPLPGEGAQP
jgi:hypothetical protein